MQFKVTRLKIQKPRKGELWMRGSQSHGTSAGVQTVRAGDGDQDSEMLELVFNTAWSPPQGVVEKMREKYPGLTFQCFYDEPGCEIAGYY